MSNELRLAVAMRGGVSLAVWIGGAISEIDLVRRCPSTSGDDFWRKMLELSEHDRVVVDVLAGASAGGLNGVLYAASQVYGFRYGAMRDIWLNVGGTEGLVRREGPWPSLFRGDQYFLEKVHEHLDALARAEPETLDAGAAGAAAPPERIDLAVSATVIEPVIRPLPSPEDERLLERRHASGFRFRKPEEPWLPSDFPERDDEQFARAIWRLALAARSTSSYPGAFEAARVRSRRRESFADPETPAGAGSDVDMDGTFLDRSEEGTFVVADGGILDNIPIQCALDYVAAAPAAGPTKRVLVYLQPGAPSAPSATTERAGEEGTDAGDGALGRRSTVSVVRGVLAARVAGETINGDIAALEAYNEAVGVASTLREATFRGLENRAVLIGAAEGRRPGYRLTRAAAEAKAVVALLDDPMGALGEDAFPAKVATSNVCDETWRSPVACWPPSIRQQLDAHLSATILDELCAPGPGTLLTRTGDVGPLLRVTALLIEWSRTVEHQCAVASGIKRVLYNVRAFLGELDRARRLAWVAVATQAADHCADFASAAPDALRCLTRIDSDAADDVVQALFASPPSGSGGPAAEGGHTLSAARKSILAGIDEVVCEFARRVKGEAPGAATNGSDDLLVRIAENLVALVGPLADARLPSGSRSPQPGDHLNGVLRSEPVTLEALEALEVLCLGEFLSGLPGRREIDFRRISSASRTPLAQEFEALQAEAHHLGLWWDPEATPDEQQGIHVMLKLAGNELANFSAFLLPHWRANDWMWGRLDAVSTLVDLLVQPDQLGDELVAEIARGGDPLEVVHRLVAPPGHPWEVDLDATVWAPCTRRGEIASEVVDLVRAPAGSRQQIPIPAIRTALVARRQWEILRDEYRLSTDPMGHQPGVDRASQPEFTAVREWVRHYAVGAETLRGNERTSELLERFEEISKAATEMVVWNAPLTRSRERSFSSFTLKLVRLIGPKVGRALARRLVLQAEGSDSSRTKKIIALAAAVLVVLGVLGWFIDKWAFLLGFAVSFLPLGIIVGVAWKLLRRAIEHDP